MTEIAKIDQATGITLRASSLRKEFFFVDDESGKTRAIILRPPHCGTWDLRLTGKAPETFNFRDDAFYAAIDALKTL